MKTQASVAYTTSETLRTLTGMCNVTRAGSGARLPLRPGRPSHTSFSIYRCTPWLTVRRAAFLKITQAFFRSTQHLALQTAQHLASIAQHVAAPHSCLAIVRMVPWIWFAFMLVFR